MTESLLRSVGFLSIFRLIIIIIIIILFWEFFTPALTDSFSLEFEWQPVSSSLQGSSQYGEYYLSNAVVWMVSTHPLISKSSSPSTSYFGNCTECTSYYWYHRHNKIEQKRGNISPMINLRFRSWALPLNPEAWGKVEHVYHWQTTVSPTAINRY